MGLIGLGYTVSAASDMQRIRNRAQPRPWYMHILRSFAGGQGDMMQQVSWREKRTRFILYVSCNISSILLKDAVVTLWSLPNPWSTTRTCMSVVQTCCASHAKYGRSNMWIGTGHAPCIVWLVLHEVAYSTQRKSLLLTGT